MQYDKKNIGLMLKLNISNIYLEKVSSTQTFAKENYKNFITDSITCILAEEQTNGTGRFQRKWVATPFQNITATFYFSLPSQTKDITALGLLFCFSLATYLIDKGFNPKIRWPNDILLSNKKLSGVLCETIFQGNTVHLFLGVGINVNMDKEQLSQIDQPATSLKNETYKEWNKKELLDNLQKYFLEDLKVFLEKGFEPFFNKFEKLLAYKNEIITLFDGENSYQGELISITPSGELKLKLENGELKIFKAGDILKKH